MIWVVRASAALSIFSLLLALGCSSSGIKTHTVAGKVEIKDGDAAILTGSTVELKHESDEAIRPYGNIDSNGKFALKTMVKGKLLSGAPTGKYQARIILADPSDEGVPKRNGDPINKKYYDFATSGLTMAIPGGDYNVSLSKK
ncbi:MAG TPA: hypothetical protein VGI40_15760 [Pirellulaceae bacterium]|jgi:hypothetical protein